MEIMENKTKSQLKEAVGVASSSDRNDHVCCVLLLGYLHVPAGSQALGYSSSSLSSGYNCSPATATDRAQSPGNGSRGYDGYETGPQLTPKRWHWRQNAFELSIHTNLIRIHFQAVHSATKTSSSACICTFKKSQARPEQSRAEQSSTAQASYQLSYLRLRSAEFRLLINCKYVNIY